MLNPIAGDTRYVSSNTDLGDLVNDFLGSVLKQHSPITMFSYDEDGNLDGLGDETSQNEFYAHWAICSDIMSGIWMKRIGNIYAI